MDRLLKLTDYLEKWTLIAPDRPLYTFLSRSGDPVASYSYASFHARTNGLAHILVDEIGIVLGEPVLLVYPPGLEMISAFMACVKAGAIPVPVPPPAVSHFSAASQRLTLISKNAGATRALTDQGLLSAISKLREASSTLSTVRDCVSFQTIDWIATNGLGEPLTHFEQRNQCVLFLQYTSGSTQGPRGVMISHENIINNSGCDVVGDHPIGVLVATAFPRYGPYRILPFSDRLGRLNIPFLLQRFSPPSLALA